MFPKLIFFLNLFLLFITCNPSQNCIAALNIKDVIPANYDFINPYDIKLTRDAKKGYVSLTKNHCLLVIDFTKDSPLVISQINFDEYLNSEPKAMAINPVNDFLYVIDEAKKLIVISTNDNSIKQTIDLDMIPKNIIVSPDGNYIFISFFNPDIIKIFSTNYMSLKATITFDNDPDIIGMTISNNKLYAVSTYNNCYECNQIVYVIDLLNLNTNFSEKLNISKTISVDKSAYEAVSNNDYVFISHKAENKISIIDTDSDSLIIGNNGETAIKNPEKMIISDYLLFVLNTEDSTFTMINTLDYKKQTFHTGGKGTPMSFDMNIESKELYVLHSNNGSVSIIDINPLLKFRLNVIKSGRGTVISNPEGISCGKDCSEIFEMNSEINLFAEPAFEFTLTGWSEALCQTNNNCAISMNRDITILANFNKLNLPQSKAIIVAGGGEDSNNLWYATQLCADKAFKALEYQKYSLSNIYYISDEPTYIEIDNQVINIVNDEASNLTLNYAITDWALNTDPPVHNLLLYMVDHGSNDFFRMNSDELLHANKLNEWLDYLQERISGNIIIIYDACKSGSFIDNLSKSKYKNRIIITSSKENENATFKRDGGLSFSFQFWSFIHNGFSLYESYVFGLRMMEEFQTALIDADGDGISNNKEDKIIAENIIIGNGFVQGNYIPKIGEKSEDIDLYGSHKANIWVKDVIDEDGISEVWGEIIEPDANLHTNTDDPITDLPKINLKFSNGIYSGYYNKFYQKGIYKIIVYAQDNEKYYSEPQIIKVTQHCPKMDYNGNCKIDIPDALLLMDIINK